MRRTRYDCQRILGICALGGVLTALQPQAAHADEWGCEVLLCMSNPAGPEAVSQCVPPMQRFYDVRKHGGSRPTCVESGWSGDIGYQPYECPAGFTLTNLRFGAMALCESSWGGAKAAERRPQPYFVDIPNTDGQPGMQRIWLSGQ